MKRTILFISIILTALTLAVGAGIVKAFQNRIQVQTVETSSLTSYSEVPVSLPVQATPTPYTPVLSSDQAAQLALAAAGEGAAINGIPTLVSFNGTTAYEVILNDGSKLYIDATSGALLYNSLTGDATAAIGSVQAAQIATTYFGGGEVYGVSRVQYQNSTGYAVYFWNGNVAVVDMRGNVLYGQIANTNQTAPTTNVGEEEDDHD